MDSIPDKHNAGPPDNEQLSTDIKAQMETNINFLKSAASQQAEATEKANALVSKLEKLYESAVKNLSELQQAPPLAQSSTPYKDAWYSVKNHTRARPPNTSFSTASTSKLVR